MLPEKNIETENKHLCNSFKYIQTCKRQRGSDTAKNISFFLDKVIILNHLKHHLNHLKVQPYLNIFD